MNPSPRACALNAKSLSAFDLKHEMRFLSRIFKRAVDLILVHFHRITAAFAFQFGKFKSSKAFRNRSDKIEEYNLCQSTWLLDKRNVNISCCRLETYHSTSSAEQALPAKVNISSEETPNTSDEDDAADTTMIDMDRKDFNPRDQVVFTVACKSISPCIAVVGTLAITTNAVYFSLDENNSANMKLDPKVSDVSWTVAK